MNNTLENNPSHLRPWAYEEFVIGSEYEHIDVLALIEVDHRPILNLSAKMRDEDLPMSERIKAFQDCAPLLQTLERAKELSLYEFMRTNLELRKFSHDGFLKNLIIDELSTEIGQTADEAHIGAKLKVLADLVHDHLYDEEHAMFPFLRDQVPDRKLKRLARTYIIAQTQVIEAIAQ